MALALGLLSSSLAAGDATARFRGALLTAEMASPARLADLRGNGFNAVVLMLDKDSSAARNTVQMAAERIGTAGLELWYWIEIARHSQFADEHPQWMASLQGHQEWRRDFKNFPAAKPGEVVKNYPWVPILSREAFDAHLARVKALLAARPMAQGVLLNDLQGGPSACGCGNPVCRWTADYGPIKTATPLGDDAAARFVAEVGKLAGDRVKVVPVWTTECEAHDAARDALCAGVGCFKGICWKAYSRQLRPLAEQSPTLAALLLYKRFGQNTRNYTEPAGWVGQSLRGFQTMPPRNGANAVEPHRLIAILQGWDVTDEELTAQQVQAETAGASGWVVAFAEIDQSWSPRLFAHSPPDRLRR